MKHTSVGALILVTALWLGLTQSSYAQECESGTFEGAFDGEVVVPQNWNCRERQDFWFTDQGSQIIPYIWMLNLEQVGSRSKFKDNMDRLGYLPQKPTKDWNPDGLPIGFTKGNAKGNKFYGGISKEWLGMTCAACHTGQIEFNGSKILIEGAPTTGDFEKMLLELVAAMQATHDDDAKFERFASAVISQNSERRAGGTGDKKTLRNQLKQVTGIRHAWNGRNQGSEESGKYGPGRLDALGAIFNETAATALGVPDNKEIANAPVSYPFIWDTPQHDKVQWNGSIKNAALGSLSRNVGEVLGVFGSLELDKDSPLPIPLPIPIKGGHTTSVNVGALAKLEGLLWKLQSPLWSDTSLPSIDEDLAKDGREVFEQHCISCHQDIDRSDESRKIAAKMFPIVNPKNPNDPDSLGTDPTMAINFLTRAAKARELTGLFTRYVRVLSDGEKFEQKDQDEVRKIRIIAYSVAGTIIHNLIRNPDEVIAALKAGKSGKSQDELTQIAEDVKKLIAGNGSLKSFIEKITVGLLEFEETKLSFTDKLIDKVGDKLKDYENTNDDPKCFPDGMLPCYKARPLNGIWATAPYLHNGSVRNMRQLLLPSKCPTDVNGNSVYVAGECRQATFHVGSRRFDDQNIGFADDGYFVFNTKLIGNSNKGHEGPAYGYDELAKDPKLIDALLEYLKSL